MSINDGKLPTFDEVTNTLKNIHGIVPMLPKNLDEIDFDLPEYKLYTETSDFKPFLQYNNNNKKEAIDMESSGYGSLLLTSAMKHSGQHHYVLFGQKNLMILPYI